MALYRNWNVISKVARDNWMLMMLLSFVEINEDDDAFLALYTSFAKCFDTEPDPPVKLSAIRAQAARQKDLHCDDCTSVLHRLEIPYIEFGFSEFNNNKSTQAIPRLSMPHKEGKLLKLGSTFPWYGKELIVVQNASRYSTIMCTPPECVIVDL